MRFQRYLQEKFAGSRKVYSYSCISQTSVDFFTNPTTREINDAQKASGRVGAIRFFVNFEKKEVLIWEGGAVHIRVSRVLKITESEMKKLFRGRAEANSGKMYITGSDDIECKKYKGNVLENLKKNKKWLSKYFLNIPEFIKKVEDQHTKGIIKTRTL